MIITTSITWIMYILCYPNSIPILPTPSHIWSVHPFVTPYPLLRDPPPPPAKGHRARAQGCEGAAAGHCHNPYHLGIIFKPSLYCDIGPIGDALWLGLPHHSIYLFLLLSEISGWSMNVPCVAQSAVRQGHRWPPTPRMAGGDMPTLTEWRRCHVWQWGVLQNPCWSMINYRGLYYPIYWRL